MDSPTTKLSSLTISVCILSLSLSLKCTHSNPYFWHCFNLWCITLYRIHISKLFALKISNIRWEEGPQGGYSMSEHLPLTSPQWFLLPSTYSILTPWGFTETHICKHICAPPPMYSKMKEFLNEPLSSGLPLCCSGELGSKFCLYCL